MLTRDNIAGIKLIKQSLLKFDLSRPNVAVKMASTDTGFIEFRPNLKEKRCS